MRMLLRALFCLVIGVTAAHAQLFDSGANFTPNVLAKPVKGSALVDNQYNCSNIILASAPSSYLRIAGDSGTAVGAPVTGNWGTEARHHYFTDTPWSRDGAYYYIQNNGTAGDVILNGNTFVPVKAGCTSASGNSISYSWWNVQQCFQSLRIATGGTKLFWYDPFSCTATNVTTMDFSTSGATEAQSEDGTIVVIGDSTNRYLQAVRMVDGGFIKGHAYDTLHGMNVGDPQAFSTCGTPEGATTCVIDWVQVSKSGAYVAVSFENAGETIGDYVKVYDINQSTLDLTEHVYDSGASYGCNAGYARGFIMKLGHASMGTQAFLEDAPDVLVGQNQCSNSGTTLATPADVATSGAFSDIASRVMAVRLDSGHAFPVAPWLGKCVGGSNAGAFCAMGSQKGDLTGLQCNGGGSCSTSGCPSGSASNCNEYPYTVSMMAYDKPGWALVTYGVQKGSLPFSGELVAFPLGYPPTGNPPTYMIRFGRNRSYQDSAYRHESHAVPSPNGKFVAFASDWNLAGETSGGGSTVQDYIITVPWCHLGDSGCYIEATSPIQPGQTIIPGVVQ